MISGSTCCVGEALKLIFKVSYSEEWMRFKHVLNIVLFSIKKITLIIVTLLME